MPIISIIGIAGRARSGKDTIANFILTMQGGYRYSFADPIRNMLKALGIDLSHPYWLENKENIIPVLGASPRRLMQTLGTEWGRKLINPDLWLIMATQHFAQQGPGMIIADIRFENEAKWVRNNGGIVIHVDRPNIQKVEDHVSEQGIEFNPLTDKLLPNNGSLERLYLRTQEILTDVHKT